MLSNFHKKSFWKNIWQSLFRAGKCPAHQMIGNEVADRAMLINLVSWVSWAVIGSSIYISVSEKFCFSIWACNLSYTLSHLVSICAKEEIELKKMDWIKRWSLEIWLRSCINVYLWNSGLVWWFCPLTLVWDVVEACNVSYTLSHPLSICEKEEIELKKMDWIKRWSLEIWLRSCTNVYLWNSGLV